jgi:hypothetical protein
MTFLPRVLDALRAQARRSAIRSVVPAAQMAQVIEKDEIDMAVGYVPPLAPKNFRQRRVSTQRFRPPPPR